MLRVALPNKGSLAEGSLEMLRESGYSARPLARELLVRDHDNDTEFFFLRPRDIATYVGSGQLDIGFTGRDLLLDSGAPADEVLALGFGGSTFRYATTPGVADSVEGFEGLRVATSYPVLVADHLASLGVTAKVVRLDGAVENAIKLGVADAIADVVSTGTTLAAAGLVVVGDPILRSEAVLVRRSDAPESAAVDQLVRRVNGVLAARAYVMMDYDIRADLVEAASALTPGVESPTVSPLREEGWVAVRAMVPRRDTHRCMDELWAIGARGIIVTDIHACRI